jgi:alkylation response protein AidB-like acyl-CoA dehydrogenase
MKITSEMGSNEVFYDGLQVPRQNLVGKLNEGWQVGDSKAGNARSDRK